MIWAATVFLSGCGASSLDQLSSDNTDGTETAAPKKEVTGSIVPTSATPDEFTQQAGGAPESGKVAAEVKAISAVSTPGSSSYKIGPQDVLDISVFKAPELSKVVQVSESGTINLPLVGEIVTVGRTPREVEKELTKLLGAKYLQKPQVTVFVKEYNSQRVTIEGAVKKPGVFPIQGSMSLLQAVAMAQGMDAISDDTIVVFRTTGGKRAAARFDISEIREGASTDPQLQAGDIIVAGSSALKEGFGNVMKVLPVASVFALF
jgi:polysaccharide biosynthesis/export protein